MKRTVLTALPLAIALFACGGKTPPADSPENADESASDTDKPKKASEPQEGESESSSSAIASAKDPVVPVTVRDEEGKKKDVPCGGSNIPDLLAVAQQTSCEVNDPQAEVNRREVKDILEVKVATDPKIAPGATAKVVVTLHNKGKTPLPLDFALDPELRFSFEVLTKKGQRVDNPAGKEPPLPPEVTGAPTPERRIARVLLAPNGNATIGLSWDAVKYKWASKDRAKGAVPGRGYPREPGGPLGKGKYVLRVVMPLVGIAEGVDHEVTHPKVDVEVAPQ